MMTKSGGLDVRRTFRTACLARDVFNAYICFGGGPEHAPAARQGSDTLTVGSAVGTCASNSNGMPSCTGRLRSAPTGIG